MVQCLTSVFFFFFEIYNSCTYPIVLIPLLRVQNEGPFTMGNSTTSYKETGGNFLTTIHVKLGLYIELVVSL